MTTFYSTASHFRHPWFDNTIMKRKHPVPLNPDEDMDDEDETLVERATKRRRCTMLENGIAHLSLRDYAVETGIVEEHDSPPSPALAMNSEPSSTFSSGGDRRNIVLPGSVEEPEIKMGSSSWYEPERDRVVITDLDGYANEVDEELNEVDVNAAFLSQLRRGHLQPPPRPESKALVVFRPLPFIVGAEPERNSRDDDAMDLDT